MYKFGKNSLKQLDTCHEDLKKIMNLAISRSNIDFGISEGYRTVKRQKELYLQGKSKIDGIRKFSKHNKYPSHAVDIYVYHPDYDIRRELSYDKVHLAYVCGIIKSCSEELYSKGEIGYKLRFGLNWDDDGIIDFDQSFDDYPHIELV